MKSDSLSMIITWVTFLTSFRLRVLICTAKVITALGFGVDVSIIETMMVRGARHSM
jgi:hypothetical protein